MKLRQKQLTSKFLLIISLVIIISITSFLITRDLSQVRPQLKTNRRLYTTSTTRLPIVSTYCSGSAISILSSDRNTNAIYLSTLSSYLKANSTKLVTDLVNSNYGDLMAEIQINGAGTIAYMSPFIIGLIFLILASPCLLCCCTCQESCPPKCCRDKNPNYSDSQLTTSTVFLILLSLIIISTGIAAMTNSKSFFSDFNCQVSKFIDDFYNGNSTQNQQYFFSGVSQIRRQFTSVLAPKLSNVQTEITKLNPTPTTVMATLSTDTNTVLTSLQSIPRGSDSLQFTQTYNEPLESGSTTGTFSTVLGPQIGTYGVSSTLLGSLYSYISGLQTNMSGIATSASSVTPHLTAGDMGSQITITDGVLASVQSNLDSLASQVQNLLSLLSNVDSYNIAYSITFYGVILGQFLLILLAIIFIKCLNVLQCRYLIYFICFIMFFFCIILFFYAIILSIITPTLYYTCSYFQNTFTSPTAFTDMIITLQGNSYSNLANKFAQCFGGSNSFMTTVNPTLQGYITQIQVAVFNSYLYDFTTTTSTINSKITTMQNTIDNIGLGHVPDFDVTSTDGQTQINTFNSIASKSLFSSSCASGSFNIFYQDVWVPGLSTTYQSYVSCLDKVGQDNTTCGSNIANTGTCSYSRCIDSFSIISTYYRTGNIANLIANANTRYGTCAPFNSYLTNFYTNYVRVVVDDIGNSVDDASNTAKLAGRFITNAKTPINNLLTELNGNVKTLFTQVYNNLTVTHSLLSIFDPSAGVFTGLDCRLLSQNGVNAKESLCITSLNRIYSTLVTVGILAFTSFFALCFMLCFNIRHYNKSIQRQERMGRIYPLDQTSSEIHMK